MPPKREGMKMSDTETEAETQVEQPTEQAVEQPAEQSEVDKWKALARKNEARAKENADKAKRLDELEEANKSELEKLLARAEAAEAKIAERDKADEQRALAKEVADAKGLADPSVLAGSTREDLEAHADRILALLPEKPKAATAGSGGNRGDDIDAPAHDIDEQIAEATKARKFALVATLKAQKAALQNKKG